MGFSVTQNVIRYDTPGLSKGVVIYQPHVGERIMGALSNVTILTPWTATSAVNNHRAVLNLYISPTGLLKDAYWGFSRAVTALEGVDLSAGAGALLDVNNIGSEIDLLFKSNAYPLRVSVDDGNYGDPGVTAGTAFITLTTVNPPPVI